MTVLHIVLTVLDWFCAPFGRLSESINDAKAHSSPRGIWENSGVIWIEPELDPSFRVLGVRHEDGAGPGDPHSYPPRAPSPAPSTLLWVCPPLDPSFKVHGVRRIGDEPKPKKFEFSDSESDDNEPAERQETAWEPWQRVSQPNALRSRGPRPHGPRAVGEAWSPLIEGR